MPRKSLDPETQQKVIAWYRHGDSIRIIAERTGSSYGQIHTIVKNSTVPLRGRGGDQRGR